MKKLPKITLMIVARDEAKYIEKAVNSLINQNYPKKLIELLLIDSLSTDGTREFLEKKVIELKKQGWRVKLLSNTKRILSSGWNLGIRTAGTPLVCRIDGHSELSKSYVKEGVNFLINTRDKKIIGVGGWLEHTGEGGWGRLLADLYSSKFGVGGSPFREKKKKLTVTDTIVFGIYWKKVFEEVGYFDEIISRNQDIILHKKMKKKGYKFITSPNMKVIYYVRSNFFKFLQKAFQDGYWVNRTTGYARHKIPILFSLYVVGGWIFSLIIGWKWVVGFIIYFVVGGIFSLKDGKGWRKLLLLPLFFIFHFTYGIGGILGLVSKRVLLSNRRR
jgi:glycosyltransferase involved in cell wall biosynthesis